MYFIFDLLLHIEAGSVPYQLLIRKCSILIYCIHPLFIRIFDRYIHNPLALFLAVSAASAFASAGIYCLSNKKVLRFLRYLA